MSFHPPSSTLQALYRVFVLPALGKQTRTSLTLPASNPSRLLQQPRTRRTFSSSSAQLSKYDPPDRQLKRNEEITSRYVYLRDAETGKLSAPAARSQVLNSLDKETHWLVQLSPDEPDNPQYIAVCRIESKKDALEAARRRKEHAKAAKKAGARTGEADAKTLELNWAIDANDLKHRLDKLRKFLEQGRRVEIVLAAKKRGRKASMDECSALIQKIKDVMESVPGARERPEGMEGKIGGMTKWSIQGKAAQVSDTSKEIKPGESPEAGTE